MDSRPVCEHCRSQREGSVLESVLLTTPKQAQQAHKVVIVATARKLLVALFNMLRKNEPYDPPEVSA